MSDTSEIVNSQESDDCSQESMSSNTCSQESDYWSQVSEEQEKREAFQEACRLISELAQHDII